VFRKEVHAARDDAERPAGEGEPERG
jgi:hypothetical protein